LDDKINVEVFKSVDEIGKASIDSLSNDGFYTYGWFKTVETTPSFKLDPFYVTVFHAGKLVAVAPCFLDSGDYYFGYYGPTVVPLMKKILSLGGAGKLCKPHVLLCYSPDCLRSAILVEKRYDGISALKLISKTIDFICQKERILFSSFIFVSEHDGLLMYNLKDLGYHKFTYDKALYLDNQWTSFDEYLKTLGHHTSNNIRREIRLCRENGIEIELVSEFGELAETLSNLSANLVWKRNKEKNPYDTVFFRNLNEFARDNIKLFVARKNSEVVGFSWCLKQGDTLDVHRCGFNYNVLGKNDFTYFNVCYYAPIRWAIENNIKKMFYARALPELKKRRGMKPENLFSFVKYQNRALSVYRTFAEMHMRARISPET
jgi:predicted N-acyltransferase